MSLRWLREYAALDAPLDHLVRTLTESGTEVGAVQDVAAGIVAARVLRLEPLPGSTHGLQLATIDIGPALPRSLIDAGITSPPVQVVTGAPNVREGVLVAYAPPGTRPPGMDEPVGVRSFRKYRSPGVLCSAAELGVGSDESGLLLLEKATPGDALRDLLDFDVIIDVEVTTNRPDCLCHTGIARELAAGLGESFNEPDTSVPEELLSAMATEHRATVRIDDSLGCPRFLVMVIPGVSIGPSPQWMQDRLRVIGLRPINNVVDATNYVAHELGQPLHAFDFDRFVAASGSERADVVIRRANDGERLVTLDDVDRELTTADIVVCSGERAVSLAGVMGGADTSVHEGTRTVLLEAATWDGVTIRGTSRRLGLRTDASTLYEKQLSDTLPPLAAARAATLIARAGGGHVLRAAVDAWPRPLPRPASIAVTAQSLSGVLGMPVDASDAATVLARLGFTVEQDGAALTVVPPRFRLDVRIAVDVAEEVGRMLGYSRVPSTLPGRRTESFGAAPEPPLEDRVRDVCVGAGYDEAITFSFVSPSQARALGGLGATRGPIPLRNPLSEEWSVLRTSQLPGLCAALSLNQSRGVNGAALFEIGRVFWEGERTVQPPGATPDAADRTLQALPLEPILLSVVAHTGDADDADAAEVALRRLQALMAWIARDLSRAALETRVADVAGGRPGRSSELVIDDHPVGVLAELANPVMEHFELRGRVVAAELRVDAVARAEPQRLRFRAPPRYPAIVQDLAVTVDAAEDAGPALKVAKRAGGTLLESAELYDEYRGERVVEGRKGWTFKLTYRAPDRTLTSEEAQRVQDAIVIRLKEQCGAELRR
ncbi:MAG: phenylalanine--tRNA ligase subunit beta [Candidatus Dormibacteria bacterium]